MPSLDWNKATWDGAYNWLANGDEWSAAWGGPGMQWHFVLLPRIQAFLPADTILEIAPGYGRWTHFLKDRCKKLVAVDYAEKCIATCKERFRGVGHIEYHVNDGQTLPMVSAGSVDFAFSFDSLVHADLAVVAGYVRELGRVLTADGVAVVHHSNLAECLARKPDASPPVTAWEQVKKLVRGPAAPSEVDKQALELRWHHRGTDVSAAAVESAARDAGLECVNQELMNWGVTPDLADVRKNSDVNPDLTDGVSILVRPGSRFSRPNRVVRNHEFMQDAARVRVLAEGYGPLMGM